MSTSARVLQTEINVTPFLDILLVLLITFLAAITARKSMDAQLPVPCEGQCTSDNTPIVLEVLADGSFLLNHRALTASELLPELRAVYAERPEKVIHVAGRRDASYQAVLSAMDMARTAGVKVISIPPGATSSP